MKGFKKSIDLGFAKLNVQWADEMTMRLEAECVEGEEGPEGYWDGEDTIYLHVQLRRHPIRAKQVLLHEIAHAVLDLYHEVTP